MVCSCSGHRAISRKIFGNLFYNCSAILVNKYDIAFKILHKIWLVINGMQLQ